MYQLCVFSMTCVFLFFGGGGCGIQCLLLSKVIWQIAGWPEVGRKIPDEIKVISIHLGTDPSMFHKPGTVL